MTVRSEEGFAGVVGDTVHESSPWWPEPLGPGPGAPNIVVVVLDDVGFADLGCYGSEVETPNIDRLAAGGLRYNGFHTTTLCSPSRASLLTGRNHHSVGMSMVAEWDTGFSNSRSRIAPAAATFPELLREAGYATFAIGKWHLAPPHETTQAGPFHNWPLGKGFDRHYGFLGGYTDQFHPELVSDNSIVEAPGRPEDGYHLSEDLVDHALGYLTDHLALAPDRPFLLYLSFGACHWPLQAPAAHIEKYRGRYDRGWDEVRAERFARQREMGVVPHHAELPPLNDGVSPWDDLSDDERRFAARLQEAYAGFLDHTDGQIGRVTDVLESTGHLDDTIVVVLSDNGASQEGGGTGYLNFSRMFNGLAADLDEGVRRIDEIGGPTVQPSYPIGWAQVSNTPLRRYKGNTHGGGIRDPLIIHWPDGITDRGAIRDQFHHIIDLAPTLLELAGVEVPSIHRGVPQLPMHGVSIAPTFAGPIATPLRTVQHFEMAGHRAIYADGWKAVTFHPPYAPFDHDTWELFRLDEDYSEVHDLAAQEPDRLAAMVEQWWDAARAYDVLPLDDRLVERLTAVGPPGSPRRLDEIVLREGSTRIPPIGAPALAGRSFELVAELEVPPGGGDGVLVANGGVGGGFVWYVQDRHVVYEYDHSGDRTRIVADRPLPEGSVTTELRFERTTRFGGIVELVIDGDTVAVGPVDRTLAVVPSTGGFQVGADTQSPASPNYSAPFRFDGRIRQVTVRMSGSVEPVTIAELLFPD